MERILMEKLVEWKDSKNRKPLILHGARQVGKTWLMKEFGKRYFKKSIKCLCNYGKKRTICIWYSTLWLYDRS